MKWYQVGEMGESVELVVEAFLEGFLTDIGFAEELTRLGLSVEEQMELLKEQIDFYEKAMLSFSQEKTTIH